MERSGKFSTVETQRISAANTSSKHTSATIAAMNFGVSSDCGRRAATAAATTEWDRDYDFDKDIKEEMERGYTLIGILPGFQFPDKFYEPVFSKEEKQAVKELELFQNTEDFWREKLNGAQETMYLQYWNGFSSYYRMVYQDEDNKRYYSVILDEAGNIKREKKMIGQEEYKNIIIIGINVK